MNNREAFNDMVSKKLAEFKRNPSSDLELKPPLPKVFISAGVSFLMECFHVEEVVNSIGYTLITNVFNVQSSLSQYWTYTKLLHDQMGTLQAFDYQTQTGLPEEIPLYCQVVNETPANLALLEFYSEFQDGDYVICLLSEHLSSPQSVNNAIEAETPPLIDELPVPDISELESQEIPF